MYYVFTYKYLHKYLLKLTSMFEEECSLLNLSISSLFSGQIFNKKECVFIHVTDNVEFLREKSLFVSLDFSILIC